MAPGRRSNGAAPPPPRRGQREEGPVAGTACQQVGGPRPPGPARRVAVGAIGDRQHALLGPAGSVQHRPQPVQRLLPGFPLAGRWHPGDGHRLRGWRRSPLQRHDPAEPGRRRVGQPGEVEEALGAVDTGPKGGVARRLQPAGARHPAALPRHLHPIEEHQERVGRGCQRQHLLYQRPGQHPVVEARFRQQPVPAAPVRRTPAEGEHDLADGVAAKGDQPAQDQRGGPLGGTVLAEGRPVGGEQGEQLRQQRPGRAGCGIIGHAGRPPGVNTWRSLSTSLRPVAAALNPPSITSKSRAATRPPLSSSHEIRRWIAPTARRRPRGTRLPP